jgi:hypothetical protein
MKVPLFFYLSWSNLHILTLYFHVLMNTLLCTNRFNQTIKVLFQVSCSRKPRWCKMILALQSPIHLLTTKPNNMKPPSHFLLLFNISLLLHKKPNLLESLLQNGAEKFCKRCYIWCCKQYFSNIPQQMKHYTKYNSYLLLLLRLSCWF